MAIGNESFRSSSSPLVSGRGRGIRIQSNPALNTLNRQEMNTNPNGNRRVSSVLGNQIPIGTPPPVYRSTQGGYSGVNNYGNVRDELLMYMLRRERNAGDSQLAFQIQRGERYDVPEYIPGSSTNICPIRGDNG